MASKSKRNKVQFKLTKELIFLVVGILAIVAVTIILGIPSKAEKQLEKYNTAITDYNTANSTSYSLLGEDHVFVEIGHNSLGNKIGSEEYVIVFYGLLTEGVYLQNLASINAVAQDYEIDKVYLYFAEWVAGEEDQDSVEFRNALNEKEALLNKNVDEDQDDFDMTTYPTLLVYNSGELIFNSQTYSDNTTYDWNMYINKALGLVVDLSESNE